MSEREGSPGLVGAVAFLGALAGILLWVLILSGPWKLVSGLLDARLHLERAENRISAGALREARYDTYSAVAATRRARQGLAADSPLLDLASSIPPVDDALEEVEHIVRAAELSAEATEGTLNVAQNALRGPDAIIANDPGDPRAGSSIRIGRINEVAITISDIRKAVEGVADELGSIDPSNLPRRLRPDIEDGIVRARETKRLLADAEAGFSVLPGFLGAEEPRTYFLAMQNSAEQRGTGGAILQFRLLSISNGDPELLEQTGGTIYEIDTNRRPIDIPLPKDAWYVKAVRDAQRFGNANWSPDWPLSAKLTIDYAGATPGTRFPEVDGVILVDPIVMQELLPGAGPFSTTKTIHISQRRVVHFLLYKAYAAFPIPKFRRARLQEVVNEFYQRMFRPRRPAELVRGIGETLAEKHMQIWLDDPREQAFIERMNWDGSIERARGDDYLYVVEQNVGGNKLDYFDRDRIRMSVSPIEDRGDVRVSTEVTVFNDVFLPQPRWSMGDSGPAHRPMINIYTPSTARLQRASVAGTRIDSAVDGLAAWTRGLPSEHSELGKKVWSTVLEIEPGRKGSVSLDYVVPDVIRREGDRSVYRLSLQHQPKVRPEDLEIRFVLPEGAAKIRADGWTRTRSADATALVWDGALKEDMTLEVSWES
jgi:DNA-directed RNA polymerase subunit K/omega